MQHAPWNWRDFLTGALRSLLSIANELAAARCVLEMRKAISSKEKWRK
jgi:hypothetical protein